LVSRRDVRSADVAKTLETSEGAVKVAMHRLRRRFRETLTDEISETVSDPADITGEIEYLLKAVSA
jgi:RNA polymerase sigma-70 factor (ECF subfamily)